MGRKKKKQTNEVAWLSDTDMSNLQSEYSNELEQNTTYSLQVDPENKYGMTDSQKQFIQYYVNFKNINTAAELANIDQDVAMQYYVAYSSQQEIRRINRALYHRQFSANLVTLDNLGSYLSSLLTGINVPVADQLSTVQKLQVVRLLIDLNKTKQESLQNPAELAAKTIEAELKELSVDSIRHILSKTDKTEKADIDGIMYDSSSLTPEEKAYLSTLSTKDMLSIIETEKSLNEEVADE